jgi:polyphosphate kinase
MDYSAANVANAFERSLPMATDNGMTDYSYTQNRDLSWLKFNERVLEESKDLTVPLLERLKFVAIFTSNLDEFFMIRVGSLYDLSMLQTVAIDNKSGMDPKSQLKGIYKAVAPLYGIRDKSIRDIDLALEAHGMEKIRPETLGGKERKFVQSYFAEQVLPILSPQVISIHHPFPHLENKALYIALTLKSKEAVQYGMIPVPKTMTRVIYLPGKLIRYLLMEDLILHYAQDVFGMVEVSERAVICVTRNADIQPDDEAYEVEENFRAHMKKMLKLRARLAPVRLEFQGKVSTAFINFLGNRLSLENHQIFYSKSPLDMSYVFGLEAKLNASERNQLVYPPFQPRCCPDLDPSESVMKQVAQKDVLIHYPYDVMDPVLNLVKEAALDPQVLSIKITLYRIDRKSKLADYLIDAADRKKEVIVIMELRARFDEMNNIEWAERLEEAGCTVIYGFERYKIHSKICLITRRDKSKLSYITHIGTGNFNEKTAKLYTDLSLITADEEIGLDANLFFKRILISNLEGHYSCLLVSPFELKKPILALIKGEIEKAQNGKRCGILMKMNALTDRDIIDALAAASQARVPVRLIIRGICCLLPGVEGKTDYIRTRSIVGRYLEHARVFCFGDGDNPVIYISSADLMTRNTVKRVEIAAPVKDTVKARLITSEGDFVPVETIPDRMINSQSILMEMAMQRPFTSKKARKTLRKRLSEFFGSL